MFTASRAGNFPASGPFDTRNAWFPHRTEDRMTSLFDELSPMRPDVRKLRTQRYDERLALIQGRLRTRPLAFDACPFAGRRILCDAFEHVERTNRLGKHKATSALFADVLAELRARFPLTLTAADRDLLFAIQGALVNPHEMREMMRTTTEHAHAQTVADAAVVDA
jgi:hypothetical protein